MNDLSLENENIFVLANAMAAVIHDQWRAGYAATNGVNATRLKVTTDELWISEHGINQVDIANTKFKHLPSDWQAENLTASIAALNIVNVDIAEGIEYCADKVHQEWLARNEWAKDSELGVPYEQLPEIEKEKDRIHVRLADSLLNG